MTRKHLDLKVSDQGGLVDELQLIENILKENIGIHVKKSEEEREEESDSDSEGGSCSSSCTRNDLILISLLVYITDMCVNIYI